MITIVTGIPHSGTSMMMHMLQEGGLPLVYDNLRPADDGNPNGYFEYRPVYDWGSGIGRYARVINHDMLDLSEGKGIKLVSNMLECLPDTHEYRLIWMKRPFEEIVLSHCRELPKKDARLLSLTFQEIFTTMEPLVKEKPFIKVLPLPYHAVLKAPKAAAEYVQQFLEIPLDTEAMSRVPDPKLYRSKELQTH